MIKNQINFFNSHLVEHASTRAGIKESTLIRLANIVSYIGQIPYSEALNKLAFESKDNLSKLIDSLNVDDEETTESVDEGNIGYHQYADMTIQNHPNELSGVNDYALLSVPSGHSG